jgi:[ribosomal protein S18]-alanine N-acetyltransferase
MRPTDIALRLACRDDVRAIALMSRDLIETGLGWSYPPDRVRRLLDDAEIACVVARRHEQLAGFGVMRFADDRAHLVLLAVRPAYQRTGIGRRIVNWLLESASVAGTATVHVELRAQNKSAFAFYRALEFCETMRLTGYYSGRETAIRMLRLLRAPAPAPEPWRPPTVM